MTFGVGKIAIIQPALPAYRLDFFQKLADHYGDVFRVYYSPVDMGVLTSSGSRASWEHPLGPMRQPLRGIQWQVGALSTPVNRGDLVVVCGAPRALTTLLLLLKIRLKGARSIWWGQYWSATSKTWRQRLRIWLSQLADGLIFYSDDEVERFRSDGWRHRGPVGALNNGIAIDDVVRLRHSYLVAKRRRNLLFIGRLTAKANLDLLLKAMADTVLSDVHLHVIGAGGEERVLRELAEANGLTSRITWHGGTTDEARIACVANRCAAFVYPGQVGLSLIHAMAYGLPTVVHGDRLRQMPEIAAFVEGDTGISFEPGSHAALAQAVAELLSDSDRLHHMSATCTAMVERNFTTDGMVRRFVAYVDAFAAEIGRVR